MSTPTIVTAISSFAENNLNVNGDADPMKFVYGTRAVQNLIGSLNALDEGQTVLTLFPIEEDPAFNEYGVIERVKYTSTILLAKKYTIDTGTSAEDGVDYYLDKYENVIKDLKLIAKTTLPAALRCIPYELMIWKISEVINLFDYNVDGVYIRFTIASDDPDLTTS